MADKIKLLPEIVANQIAAGEVVEEPASIVKEMVENSIDAGAHCVKVNFRNGGVDLIQIIDDGCGMSPFDARMAFDRHATSKIRSVEDIYALRTFGFRGEALASIAAVSQVELKTRQHDAELGVETIVNGGQFVSQKPVMTPAGSQFMVRNLFYNVPARRKFLREPARLAAAIKTEFQRAALCNPQTAFELYANDMPVYNLQPASLATRIIEVVGKQMKQNLLEIDADTTIVKIKGFVGRPAAAKKRNNEQYLFVNGRYFKSQYLSKAVLKAYEKLIPESCFPSYFIYIEVDPERVDVNVSPKKTEVKFADLEAIWQIINAAVRETLAKTGAVSLMDFDNESDIEIPVSNRGAIYAEPRSAVDENYNPFLIADDDDDAVPSPGRNISDTRSAYTPATPRGGSFMPNIGSEEFEIMSSGMQQDSFEQFDEIESGGIAAAAGGTLAGLDGGERPEFTSIICIGSGYAAAMYGRQFVVVDLKRARERIIYESYIMLMNGSSSVSQQLLFPEKLILSVEEYDTMLENAGQFADIGFDIEFAGEGTIMVKGVPAETDSEGVDRLIYELLKVFDTPEQAVEVRRRSIAATMARGAASVHKVITDDEASIILSQLQSCDNVSFTPGGKAVMVPITFDELRSKLG